MTEIKDGVVDFSKVDPKDIELYPYEILHEENGIYYDFNFGLRISFKDKNRKYHVRVYNPFTGIYYIDSVFSGENVICLRKKYYSDYEFWVYDEDEKELLHHVFSLRKKDVAIRLSFGFYSPIGLGDLLGLLEIFVAFQKKHSCNLYLICDSDQGREYLKSEVEKRYKGIHFLDISERDTIRPYASYYINFLFYCNNREAGWDNMYTPIAREYLSEVEHGTYALGMEFSEIPEISLKTKDKPLEKEKYVCISTKTKEVWKHWLFPNGWATLIKYLKEKGYKVYCIDQVRESSLVDDGVLYEFGFPEGAYDATSFSLKQKMNLLSHCDFFIGMASGLSWLARICGAKVVMISGFSLPRTEFFTPYRVINYDVCNSCYNDKLLFKKLNIAKTSCLRHEGEKEKFMCSRFITPRHVINIIEKLLGNKGSK